MTSARQTGPSEAWRRSAIREAHTAAAALAMDDVPEDPSLQLQRQITQVSGETNATAIALAMLISSLEDGQRITPAWWRAALTKLATGFADVERSRSGDPVETLTEAATEIAGRIFHDDAPQVSLMAFTPLSRIGCWWRRLR